MAGMYVSQTTSTGGPRREMRLGFTRLTIDNTIRNKKQKAGARHEVKENMAGLSATSISCI